MPRMKSAVLFHFVCFCLMLFAFVSTSFAQTPINAGRALAPLERQGLIAPHPGFRPPPPGGQPQPPPAPRPQQPAPVYYQTPPKKTNEPAAKISKKIGVSPLEVKAGKTKEDGVTGTLYVTNLTDEALSPFAQFTVLGADKSDVGVEFGRIRSLAAKEVGKMEVNTTKTGAASLKLVKISSKLGED